MDDLRRAVPRTDVVLADPQVAARAQLLGRQPVKAVVGQVQDRVRSGALAAEDVVPAVLALLPPEPGGSTDVINATGVVVHTNLGRAPLAAGAMRALQAAAGTTDVEFDLTTGERGKRGRLTLAALASAVPDAQDVHVVNNAAAALVLCATVLAQAREIVVSRGELVEIGDGFRLPDLLVSTGARLREVGTTNRTKLDDYQRAIDDRTGFILKVHPSNFVIRGFTSEAQIGELSQLGPPVVADIGSGLLRPHPLLPDEPDAMSALRAGASVVLCSGDKLLGGPQAGLLLGRSDLIEQLRRHPLARALRVDKLTLAALHATLTADETPVNAMLGADVVSLRSRAQQLSLTLRSFGIAAAVLDTRASVGGGGAPGLALPSVGIGLPASACARLRAARPAVIGHVGQGQCVLDLRTVDPSRDPDLLRAVRWALGRHD